MALYGVVLTIHSILRWVILLAALFAIIRAVTGLSFRRGFTSMDNRAGMIFVTSLDIQLLLGILLYFFLSPITTSALQNFSAAMKNPAYLFFSLEHVVLMLVAIIVAHVGRSLARKAQKGQQKHRWVLISFGIALLLILAGIPWPFLSYGRPLI